MGRPRSRRGEGQRLRGEIIAAASSLLADLGDANQLSMRAVAAAVGVTPPSIYRHFADKRSLLVAVLDERWAELSATLAQASEDVDDPFDALRRIGLAYLRFAEEHPGHYRVLFTAAGAAGISAERAQHPGGPAYSLLVNAVEHCLAAGAPASPERSSWFLAVQILISGHGLVDLHTVQHFPFPWPPPEQLLDALLADLGLSGPSPRRTAKSARTKARGGVSQLPSGP